MQALARPTALTGAASIDAEIHYSGRVDVAFPPDETVCCASARKPGNSIFFAHTINAGRTLFRGSRLEQWRFRRFFTPLRLRLCLATEESRPLCFARPFHQRRVCLRDVRTWSERSKQSIGSGAGRHRLCGFCFNNAAAFNTAGLCVRMPAPHQDFSFTVLDYFWADPESPSGWPDKLVAENGVTEEGSLGCSPWARWFCFLAARRTR